MPFHFVDVFAVRPLTGNPLSVVDGGEDLPIETLGHIAREFNQSETTFVMRPTLPGADWRLRSFSTAGVEVFGAGGHNTLGAWWWLAQAGKLALPREVNIFHQQIGDKVHPLAISMSNGKLADVVMDQEKPVVGKKLDDVSDLAVALGLEPADLRAGSLSAQVVSTGAAHLLVPVRDKDTVDRIEPDPKALLTVLKGCGGEGCYAFSLDARQPGAHAYARFFNPTIGIAEDPATGTAAGPLAYHLVSNGLVAAGIVRIEQGTAIGRTSQIPVEVEGKSVKVHGRAIVVASGNLFL